MPYLESFGPASLRVAALLEKRVPARAQGPILTLDFVGFNIPDKFIVVRSTHTLVTLLMAVAGVRVCPGWGREGETLLLVVVVVVAAAVLVLLLLLLLPHGWSPW